MLCVMRWIALILCLLTPSWVSAENLQDLLNTLNGKVIEFTGKILDSGSDRPRIMLMETESYHDFEYSISPSSLRDVRKACKSQYYFTCAMSGKAELDTSSGQIFLYITEVSEVVDLTKE